MLESSRGGIKEWAKASVTLTQWLRTRSSYTYTHTQTHTHAGPLSRLRYDTTHVRWEMTVTLYFLRSLNSSAKVVDKTSFSTIRSQIANLVFLSIYLFLPFLSFIYIFNTNFCHLCLLNTTQVFLFLLCSTFQHRGSFKLKTVWINDIK